MRSMMRRVGEDEERNGRATRFAQGCTREGPLEASLRTDQMARLRLRRLHSAMPNRRSMKSMCHQKNAEPTQVPQTFTALANSL